MAMIQLSSSHGRKNPRCSNNSRVEEKNSDGHSHHTYQETEQIHPVSSSSSGSGSGSGSESGSSMSASISIRNSSSISSLTFIKTNSNSSCTDASDYNQQLFTQLPFSKFRLQVGKFLDRSSYQLFMIAIITINAILLGIATFNFVDDVPSLRKAFEIVDTLFLVVYTIELCLTFLHLGIKKAFCDAWVDFDFVIITLSWLIYQSRHVQILRSFRILRCLKVIPRIDSLKQVIHAFVRIIPKLKAFVLVLAFLFYISAIMFTQMFR